MVKQKKAMDIRKAVVTKEDVKKFKKDIIHEFHIILQGLIDQIKLLAEGHSGIIDRYPPFICNSLDLVVASMCLECSSSHE
jgi:hypothetical protein